MKAELEKTFDESLEVQLIPSGGGVFEVVVDGNLVFSKKSLGRFPEDREVVDLINKQ